MTPTPCPRCASPVPYQTPQCVRCGHSFLAASQDAATRMLLPVGRRPLALAAGYVGLLTLAIWVLAPVSILLGVLAIRDLGRNPGKSGLGRAIFALVAGGVGAVALAAVLLSR